MSASCEEEVRFENGIFRYLFDDDMKAICLYLKKDWQAAE